VDGDNTEIGGFPTRNVDTVHYRVARELPPGNPLELKVGDAFSTWPIGEVLAHVYGRGPITTNATIAEWEKAGIIERVAK
jgi:hypothetical protein